MSISPNFYEKGYLELELGPMRCGKTVSLMDKLNRLSAVYPDRKTLVISPKKDTRNDGKISTHSGNEIFLRREIDCIQAENISDIDFSGYKNIGIDEANMFPDIIKAVENLVKNGKQVYVSGLTGSFRMKKFDDMNMFNILDLIPIANKFHQHEAICEICAQECFTDIRNAAFTKRIVDDDSECLVGSEQYIPVCRYHHH